MLAVFSLERATALFFAAGLFGLACPAYLHLWVNCSHLLRSVGGCRSICGFCVHVGTLKTTVIVIASGQYLPRFSTTTECLRGPSAS
ncbi:hypothetical protein B0J13DRAFT_547141 [Dactylonectria estremocensis]|uniref:Uncharacterized protein n=1 Tax=Dactylonectria estremocensis TaxID=1079267 RepID=A0A9P9JAW6_9HYPO|nr:hypothetical protein B0J13DRAFT_547141 [Dactylonectria estremocensis]